MKKINLINGLTCAAIVLLTVAILSINGTFSIENDTSNLNVYLTTNEDGVLLDQQKKNRIDFGKTLKPGETYSFEVDAVNSDDVNAEIRRAIKSDLHDYKVGTSKTTGKTYYYDDYISYSVIYLESNSDNNISIADRVEAFDSLNANTINKIKVMVNFDKTVTDDMKQVLVDTYGGEYIKASLYLHINFEAK